MLPFSVEYINKLNEIFVHLHVHSEYSNIRILDSINKIKDMVLHANSLGNKAMALSDHETVSGHVKFLNVVKELKSKEKIHKDFKPILGNEIYLVDEETMYQEMNEWGRTQFYHFLVLAKDDIGHEQLRKLSSTAWKRMFNYKGIERVPTFYSDVELIVNENRGHLIVSSACLGGRLPNLIMRLLQEENEEVQEQIKDEIDYFINWCLDLFGEDFYIELQPSLQQEQMDFNAMAIKIAKAYDIKWIVTTDAHYLTSKDREVHKAFLTSEEDSNGNREVDMFYSTTHFFTVGEIFENMYYLEAEDIERGILTTKEIADKIIGYDFFAESIIPLRELPNKSEWHPTDKKTLNKYPYIKELYEDAEKQHTFLITQTFKGIVEREIKKDKLNEVLERINIECKEIIGASKAKHQPMGAYLNTMQKNVDIIWEDAESFVGPGRGSANGYIINYLLGITQVNPLEQGVEMPHWRFMSAERPDIFDIDIDYSSHKKDIVMDKIVKYYQSIGGDAVRVSTFGTETSKSAIQTACRGLHINNDVALYLSSLVPVERGKVWSVHDCFYGNEEKGRKQVTEFRNMISEYTDKNLLNIILGIEGLINKRSTHACFDKETLITTSEGLKRIIDVKIGDSVLTHKKRFKPVVDLIKTKASTIYTLKTKASFPVEVTEDHPFYVRERTDIGRVKTFSQPKWKQVYELTIGKDYIGIPINNESIIPDNKLSLPFDNENFWWIIGRYIGDGWTESYPRQRKTNEWIENRIIICCTKVNEIEKQEIIKHLVALGFEFRTEEVNTTYKIHIKNKELYTYLQGFGKYAHGKYINQDLFNLPRNLIKTFLNGYLSADGHHYLHNDSYCIKTVSKHLAIGVMQLINKAYQRYSNITILPPKTEYIEGREINSKEKYEIRFTKDTRSKEKSFYEDGYIWTRLSYLKKKIEYKSMYNLTVLDDNSYVAHGLGVHNCGVIIVNEEFTKHNSIMRSPSGELISAYELHDSEQVSNLKYDFLNTKTESMLQLTMEMLVKNNKMKWQGSLRKTYNKYLHPDVIDFKSKGMWDILCKGEMLSAFQFESNVGEQAIKLIQPQNLIDAANGNTVMRLMVDEGEQPLEKFVRYKNDISEWYRDMEKFGLNKDQIKIMEKHLLQDNGVCSSQERMMLLTMDKDVSGFGVIESNKLRKGCAKKLQEVIDEAKTMFFEWGKKSNTPQILMDYIWDEQIAMQLGYGFSILHAVAYTIILIQQLNLVYYYPAIYWNTAVLMVESGAVDRETSEDSEIEAKERTTNYGEIAKAIGKLQAKNINISLPYVNKAEQGFLPNEENNEIIFGFKGIMKINNETAQIIMQNRPFISLKDFHERLVLVKREVTLKTGKTQMRSLVAEGQTIMLIKAGAFDKIENKPREEILEDYLRLLNPSKQKLNSKDIAKIAEMGIIPSNLKDEMKFYNFREYLTSMSKKQDEQTKTIFWYKIHDEYNEEDTDYANSFFLEHFANEMEENKDYKYNEEGYLLVALGTSRKGSFDSLYKKKISQLSKWITTEECINTYTENIFQNIKNEFMQGTVSSWEMESMNYYYHQHELANIDKDKYGVVDFKSLPEDPIVIGFTKYKGLQYPKFQLDRIVGTVLDRDKNKHSVTILTPDGVVVLKFYSGQFSFYDKTISKDIGEADETGKVKKVVLENGWFQRGNLIMVTGFRRGDIFKPKRYKNSIYQHALSKIVEVREDNELVLQNDRVQLVE